jgi:hypothetical protein
VFTLSVLEELPCQEELEKLKPTGFSLSAPAFFSLAIYIYVLPESYIRK